jgi:Ca2+-binding RTX toxin-like protein
VQSADCGDGNDTIYINPYNRPGGVSNAQALRDGRIRRCETVIEQAPEADPTRGISWSGSGTKHGTDRNDKLLGGHESDRIYGLAGDDVLWADSRHDSGGSAAKRQKDFVSGDAGDDTIYGGRGRNTLLGGDGNDFIQGNGVSTAVSGGNGNDNIRVTSGGTSKVDAGAGDDVVSAIIGRGSARIACGPGNDTVIVSRFKSNRKRTKVAGDCEHRQAG